MRSRGSPRATLETTVSTNPAVSAAPIELIGLPQSDFVWATRIVAAERGIDVVHRSAAPHTPEVWAISPVGKIPVLRHGNVRLSESRAICLYLDGLAEGASLDRPEQDLLTRARDEQWLSIVLTTIEPILIRQYLFAYLFPGTPDGAVNPTHVESLVPALEAQLDLVETALAEGWVGGERFGLADAYLIPILASLRGRREADAAIARRPPVSSYLEAGLRRPSVRATMPA